MSTMTILRKTQTFLQYTDKISSHKHISLFMLLLSVLYTILFCNISYITDSYEYGIVASCWIDPNFVGMDCSQVNYLFDSHYLPFSLLSYPFRPLHRYRFLGLGFFQYTFMDALVWWNKDIF